MRRQAAEDDPRALRYRCARAVHVVGLLTAVWMAVVSQAVLAVGSASNVGSAAAREPDSSELGRAAAAEVVGLHRFIEGWSTAAIPNDDASFDRFASVLAPEFTLVGPDGTRADREAVVAGFRASHGRWQGRTPATVSVRDVRVRMVAEPWALLEYVEEHVVGDEVVTRRSTVLMRGDAAAPGGVLWVHLHETWID